jgi:hypothetical protein
MNYPQISGEPNFVLIGVAAVFGLMVIIMIYYIFVSRSRSDTSRLMNNRANNSSMSTPMRNGTGAVKPTVPVPIGAVGASETAAPVKPVSSVKQVFNVKENIYTLEDSEAVCGALGAEVASMDQLIEAHRQGADWCNVGWTKDGLAAYPIQYSTWKTLQDNIPGKRNICGKPGINLVRNNPDLLYGVNCYGMKPEPKGNEKIKQPLLSDKQMAINAKIAEFQKNMNSIGIAPFNADKWAL